MPLLIIILVILFLPLLASPIVLLLAVAGKVVR
nr:MAG TPA: hypothetical protein [Caudoviricetes sp.]